jgi:hypothetical protein
MCRLDSRRYAEHGAYPAHCELKVEEAAPSTLTS